MTNNLSILESTEKPEQDSLLTLTQASREGNIGRVQQDWARLLNQIVGQTRDPSMLTLESTAEPVSDQLSFDISGSWGVYAKSYFRQFEQVSPQAGSLLFEPLIGLLVGGDVRRAVDEQPDSPLTIWVREAERELEAAIEQAKEEELELVPASRERASRLINALAEVPGTPPLPVISIDPDGEVSLSWQRGARLVFSISVGADGTLSYAGLFGSNEAYGKEALEQKLPKQVADGLGRLLAAPVPPEAD